MTVQTGGTSHRDHLSVPAPAVAFDVLAPPAAYCDLRPDVLLSFQLDHWPAWTMSQALPDVAATASRVGGYADFTAAFLALADRFLADERRLDAATVRRPDPRRGSRRTETRHHGALPGGPLPVYRFAMPDEATVVLGATLMSASTIVMALNARLVLRMRPRPRPSFPGQFNAPERRRAGAPRR